MRRIYRFVHWCAYLTIAHGFAYWIIKEFFQKQTPYGIQPHPYQTHIQALHVVLSPLLVFAFGMLWRDHVWPKFKSSKKKKISGTILLVTMIIMIFSGYLEQVVYQDLAHEIAEYTHLGSSLIFTLFYLRHHYGK